MVRLTKHLAKIKITESFVISTKFFSECMQNCVTPATLVCYVFCYAGHHCMLCVVLRRPPLYVMCCVTPATIACYVLGKLCYCYFIGAYTCNL